MNKFLKSLIVRFPVLADHLLKLEDGYDPVAEEYAQTYPSKQWALYDKGEIESTITGLERRLGRSLADLRVLDLGGGPGHYSIGLAKRGAAVTWHDPSRAYMGIAKEHARQNGV